MRLVQILSIVLEIPEKKIRRSLDGSSVLADTGLVRFSGTPAATLDRLLHFHESTCRMLFGSMGEEKDPFRDLFHRSEAPELKFRDFAHLGEKRDLLHAFLEQALSNELTGVNILLHGAPGTGKTQFARALADQLGAGLTEVAIEERDRRPVSAEDRLVNCRLAQRILSRKPRSLVLFDEVDELFPGTSLETLFGSQGSLPGKGWFTRTLEDNPVPTLWVCNDIEHVDKALLRRFKMVLEFEGPPAKERIRIVRRQLQGTGIRDQWVARVARHRRLSPGLIAQAASVVRTLQPETPEESERMLGQLLQMNARAMGEEISLHSPMPPAFTYRPDLLNADLDLDQLVNGMRRHGEARLCLYGPPGTGKTEFGRFVARELGRPLLVTRASDLLSQFVGGTERNIARMFAQARSNDAVLLLDEADSFLRDRRDAHRSWEVTQVNELLTRMEAFDGIFICSTNLMERLDRAALRRFDLKIHFDYLNPSQSWKLFRQVLRDQGAPRPRPAKRWKKMVAEAGPLTPGDFATAIRQNRLQDSPMTPETLLESLRREVEARCPSPSRGIGFLARV